MFIYFLIIIFTKNIIRIIVAQTLTEYLSNDQTAKNVNSSNYYGSRGVSLNVNQKGKKGKFK